MPQKNRPLHRARLLPFFKRGKIFVLSCTVRPSAKRILRLVSMRQSLPASMRSMVDSDTPARLASSALAINWASRNLCTLFTGVATSIGERISRVIRVGVKQQGCIEGALSRRYNSTAPSSMDPTAYPPALAVVQNRTLAFCRGDAERRLAHTPARRAERAFRHARSGITRQGRTRGSCRGVRAEKARAARRRGYGF